MNERIKELAEEHGFIHEYMTIGERNDALTKYKEFAQLIAKECVDIISPYTVRMGRPGEEYLHPIQEIKKHFGMNP